MQLREPLQALALYSFVDIVCIVCGPRTFLRRVSEGSYSFELHLLEKLQQLLKLFVGFTGEADDASRSYCDIGHRVPEFPDALANGALPFGSSHPRENDIGSVLNRHVEVRKNALFAGNDVQQPVRDSCRIEIQHPNPRNCRGRDRVA